MSVITYREALNQGLAEELGRDPNVVLMGEEVAQFKGSYKVSEGLLEKYGPSRIIDTPISEAAFSGLAVGASMMGMRPVVEFMFWSFCYVAFDQIFNNAANVRYMSGGLINVPVVFRGPANGGTNVGATHSHTPENFAANTPGMKVVCPSTPADAKGLIKSAIRDNDPVCFMENISAAIFGGQTLAKRCELAGVKTPPNPNKIAPIGYNHIILVETINRLAPIINRAHWLILTAPYRRINPPQHIAVNMDAIFCIKRYNPNQALEISKSSAILSANIGMVIWQT